MPGERYFMISNGDVSRGGVATSLSYDNGHLLQAENEYNKAALSTTTLSEYKEVIERALPEKSAEHPSRESRNVWTD